MDYEIALGIGLRTVPHSDRYRVEYDSRGRKICRDTYNGQFSEHSNCNDIHEFYWHALLGPIVMLHHKDTFGGLEMFYIGPRVGVIGEVSLVEAAIGLQAAYLKPEQMSLSATVGYAFDRLIFMMRASWEIRRPSRYRPFYN